MMPCHAMSCHVLSTFYIQPHHLQSIFHTSYFWIHVQILCCLVSFPNLHWFSLPARATVAGSRVPTVPGRRHQANLQTSHLEAWDNFRETQSWSWFMLRPTYPYVPVLFVVFRQKMKCQNVPANLFCFATTPEVAFMAQWTALPIQ